MADEETGVTPAPIVNEPSIDPADPDVSSIAIHFNRRTGHVAVNHNCESQAEVLVLLANGLSGIGQHIQELEAELFAARRNAVRNSIVKPGDAEYTRAAATLLVPGGNA